MTDGNGAGSARRVVITGMGVVSPLGNDNQTTWEALLAGTSGGDTIRAFEATEDFPTRIACEVKDFDPQDYMDRKEARRYDRVSQFALAAAVQFRRLRSAAGGGPARS